MATSAPRRSMRCGLAAAFPDERAGTLGDHRNPQPDHLRRWSSPSRVKYVVFILRADNRAKAAPGDDGAGPARHRQWRLSWTAGLIASPALPVFRRRHHHPGDLRAVAVGMDEGRSQHFEEAVIPISLVILLAMFLMQYRGTGSIGRMFWTVCALWFSSSPLGRRRDPAKTSVLTAVAAASCVRFCCNTGGPFTPSIGGARP